MFGLFKPTLPITEEQRQRMDRSFLLLASLIGAKRLLEATVVLPTSEHFPDPYDRSESALHLMLNRVAVQMGMNSGDVSVTLFVAEHDMTKSLVPFYSGDSSGAAGLYHHDPSKKAQISIDEKQLKDPVSLVATLAHELGHVLLLRPGLVSRDDPEMEPLNDLLTIFLGFGIFTANAAFQFEQHSDHRSQGWSAHRQGYLSEAEIGFALARFAYERREAKPRWTSFLATNVAAHMKRSLAWLRQNSRPRLFG